MEGSNKGIVKEAASISYLEKTQADFAQYLRSKHFSGKDIYGEEIFEKTTIVNGITFKTSRFSPTKSYEDPMAYLNEVAKIKKKSLADTMTTQENRIRPLRINSESTRKQVVQDVSDESSDSLQEISVDVWNEVQSAKKLAKSDVGPFYKRLD